MCREQGRLPYVIIRDSEEVLQAYIEDNDVPIRMATGDTCLARGEIVLTEEQQKVLSAIDTPLFRRKLESLERVSKEAIRELLCAALVEGFQSEKDREPELERSG